jgi:hypothetical protein
MSCSTLPWQNLHCVSGISVIFWNASKTSPHWLHWYSYIGTAATSFNASWLHLYNASSPGSQTANDGVQPEVGLTPGEIKTKTPRIPRIGQKFSIMYWAAR